MVINGLSAVMGSWNTMAMSPPRMPRISRSDKESRSRPRSRAWPLILASPARRSRLKAVMVLPEPDSPTSASFSPGAMLKLTPRTTSLLPKRTDRSCTSSSGAGDDGKGCVTLIACRFFARAKLDTRSLEQARPKPAGAAQGPPRRAGGVPPPGAAERGGEGAKRLRGVFIVSADRAHRARRRP